MNPHTNFTYATYLGAAVIEPPHMALPVLGASARLGFPSPADDFLDDALDLNDYLVKNPASTFMYRAEGDSMLMAGIRSGDILIIDRSVTIQNGDLVLACWGGDSPICKIIQGLPDQIVLHSANPDFPALYPPLDAEVELFAVISIVRKMVRSRGRRVRPR
jgi:DNA polymerase V